ncbi:SDR family oxidoreductase [Streptomyces coacervatus]|uniref:SDR family oxidoreductase n=1 Tax=Streptomyces coacervatus TaxID=647381 RepID=UPI0023DB7A9F|nr:SDR family oxidoreductase [Streptomyces coacervatus]MDF2265148.1 SDR family oxidoreductase [Streptomyces coacervatus]
MPTTTHVVTGATGFLAAALVLELAATTDAEILCLVRPGRTRPEHRLHQALTEAATAFDHPPPLLQTALRHARPIPADLTVDGCGTDPVRLRRAGRLEFWHSAALLAHGDPYRRRIFATNTAGTRRLLELARRADADVFNHISTAYVAGRATGLVPETPVHEPSPRNHYEASKIAAERAVLRADAFPTRILRPSVVIGHSRTHACPIHYTGAYGIQQRIAAHARLRAHGPSRRLGPIRLRAAENVPFNLVPVDHVVRQAVEISLRGPAHGVFHLTNPNPPTAGAMLRTMFGELRLPEPQLTTEPTDLSAADRRLDDLLAFYTPYLLTHPHFDRTRTDAVLTAPHQAAFPMETAVLHAFFGHHARHLDHCYEALLQS